MNHKQLTSILLIGVLLSTSLSLFNPTQNAYATAATGGTITYTATHTVHTFTTSGTFTVTSAGDVDYLVVGAGGGGGTLSAGGGGAGEFRNGTGHAVTVQGYTITIGAGGAGSAVNANAGGAGGSSIFDTVTSIGGGGGASGSSGNAPNGYGSGGGAQSWSGGSPTGGDSTAYGNDGGDSNGSVADYYGGNGGGAGSAGNNGGASCGGGGLGDSTSISGTSITYAAGGGGGSVGGSVCAGGSGIGGDGSGTGNGSSASANTGSGGGGADSTFTGGSGGSGIVVIAYLTSNPVPTQPTNLTVTDISTSQLDLDWDDAPAYDNITGFRIFVESPTGNGWTLHTNDTASSVSALSDTGLSTKTQYNYMVAGINATGVGSNSTAAAATTYGVPDAITDLSLGATSNTMTLTWSAPTVYGYPITGYKIEYESPVGGGYSTLVADTGNTDVTYLHSGLASFTEYGYRVTAISSFGNSATSNEPSAYTVTDAPVLNVVNDCYHTCSTQLNLEFTAPTGTITGYKIEHNVNSAGFTTLVANTTNSNVVYNATGLTAGDIVSYKVSAHSAFGTSIASNEKQYSTHKLPDAVDDLVATETLLSSIDLEWTQPTINSHSITCYNINYTTPIGDPQTIITACTPTTGVTYQITGLSLGDPNSFRVSAVTPHGNNASGNIINATAFSSFTIGALSIDEDPNTNILDVLYDQVDTGDASAITVRFPNTAGNMTCNLNYVFANVNTDYTNLTPLGTYDTNYDSYTFTLNNSTNEVVDFDCYDATNTAINGQYTKPQTSFPFIDMANLFRDGVTFGTDGNFGGLDMITLIVIIVSMVGFNKSNPAAGLIISIMILGATSYFGLISMSASILGVLALIVMIGIVVTRK